MKFTCKSSDLQKSVGVVEKAISSRTNLPILENVYLELTEQHLILRGHDLEIGVEHVMTVNTIEATGKVLVKSKTFSSILAKLGHDELSIEVKDSKMVISTPNVDFDILCMSSDEYPVFPQIESGITVVKRIEDISDLIKHTLFSASFDETKHFLNGVLMKNEDDYLYFVATDGYRLALKRAEVGVLDQQFSVIVPYKAMNEWSKIAQGYSAETEVELTISENQVVFKLDDTILLSRVIKGQFPDYKQVLPKETDNQVMVSRRQLLDASERASIIASASNNVVRFSFDGDDVDIVANAPTMGDFKERLNLVRNKGDESVKIAFNVRLVLDAIKILNQDNVVIEFSGGLSPCLIRPEQDDDYRYVIMPIRTNDYQEAAVD